MRGFVTSLYVWSNIVQSIRHKYEASKCQQLFNMVHWNVMTDHKNDNIAQLFYSLHKCAELL